MAKMAKNECTMSIAMCERLFFARRDVGMTQSELAQVVGVTAKMISRLENGFKKKVPASLVGDIEKALGLEPGAILSLEHAPAVTPAGYGQWRNRPSNQVPMKSKFCRHCGKALYADSNFCHNCGTRTLDAGRCQCCGSPLYHDSAFCSNCGARVESTK